MRIKKILKSILCLKEGFYQYLLGIAMDLGEILIRVEYTKITVSDFRQ